MMATVPHVTSGLGLRKFQADGFLLTQVYVMQRDKSGHVETCRTKLPSNRAQNLVNSSNTIHSTTEAIQCNSPVMS